MQAGTWSPSEGVNIHEDEALIATNKVNFLRILTLEEPPFVLKSPIRPDDLSNYYYNNMTGMYYFGYCIDLMLKLQERMGFEFELLEPKDRQYGNIQVSDIPLSRYQRK